MNKKAQIGFVIGVIGFFMALTTLSFLMTPMLEIIDVGINATNGSTHGSLLSTMFNTIPVFLVLVLLIALFSIAQLR